MNAKLRSDADIIVKSAIDAVMPKAAVERALGSLSFDENTYIIAVGKAAYSMALTASKLIPCGAAKDISGLSNVAVFSVGSDGTDGPTGTNVNDFSVVLIG